MYNSKRGHCSILFFIPNRILVNWMIVESYKNESHQEEIEYLSNALLQSKTKSQNIHSCTIFRADLRKEN